MVSHLTLSEPVSVSSVGQVEITLATGHRLMLSGAFDVDGAPSGQRSGGAMIPVPVSTKVWLAAGVTDILHTAICKSNELLIIGKVKIGRASCRERVCQSV